MTIFDDIQRGDAFPRRQSLEEVIELCGRLPLAVQIAAARLRARPTWTFAHMARLLRDQGRRLTELTAGPSSVISSFEASYQRLTLPQRRMIRLLSRYPGQEIDAATAAVLAKGSEEDTRWLLESLLDLNLLRQRIPDRYSMHHLIRLFAIHAAPNDDSASARHTTADREDSPQASLIG